MNELEAAKLLGISEKTLQAWRCNSKGPVYIKVGRTVRYRKEDLQSYIDRKTVKPANG